MKKARGSSNQKTSTQEYKHQYYLENREKILSHIKEYRKNHPELKINREGYFSNYWDDIRKQFFSMYGDICSCCGESCTIFLVLDHIKGKTRRCKGKRQSYLDALNNYDPEEDRTLCHNCNQATSNGKICPHKSISEKVGK